MSPSVLEVETKEGLAEARALVSDAIEQGLVTAAELARRTGVKPSAISAFRKDKWKGAAGTLATTASLLAKAIEQLQRQRVAEETSIGGFVSIRAAEAIYSLVQYAIKRRKIVAFTLSAGNGKTMALQQIQQDTPGAVLVTTTKRRSTPKSFLQLWSRALGLRESGRAEDLQDRLVRRLRGSDRLSLIDECHKLPVGTLDLIREVWDETRTPVCLSGTPSLYQTLTSRRVGESACELMDQLFSRIGVFRNLDELADCDANKPDSLLHTPEDIRKIFARQHVRLVKNGVGFLCRLANTPGAGGLRICLDLVQLVIDLFPGEPVTAELLTSALVSKLGPREAGFRVNQAAGQDDGKSAKVAAG